MNISRLELITSLNKGVSFKELNKIVSLIKRRAIGEPVSYITQKKEFYGREFYVNKNVLIPRPETELLIDILKDLVYKDKKFIFLDMGCGCGNIGITVACEFSRSMGIITDICKKALVVAKKNAYKFDVHKRLIFVCMDLISGIKENSLDVILSNPPYIGYKHFMSLSREVRCFEPFRALVGGYEGWELCKKLCEFSHLALKKNGLLVVEIDETIKEKIKEFLISGKRWENIFFIKDLSGQYRVLCAKK